MEFLIKKITHTILYYFLSGRLCKEQSQPRAFGLYEEAQEGIPSRPHGVIAKSTLKFAVSYVQMSSSCCLSFATLLTDI